MKPIAFATQRGLLELAPGDRLAADELRARGVAVEAAAWDDPAIDWRRFGAVVVRSCWDYTARLADFLAWADRVAAETALWNPPALLAWNARKTYLRDLAARGVDIVPTEWLPPGSAASLDDIARARGWSEVVVKPIVSASATDTFRIPAAQALQAQPLLDRLLRGSGALVQPFLPEIQSAGEWSLVFFSSGYSHAVGKRPAPGDFRVQLEHGGSLRRRHAPEALIAAARRAADALPPPWLFARVDGVEAAGRFLVMEVECIEPELYLAGDRELAGRFADAVGALAAL
jgi:glutathione synthase/RimK-type ligase-like ATP-grasp enzyme